MTSFVAALGRRNVCKATAAYAIVGWLPIHVATTMPPMFETPGAVLRAATFPIILGLPRVRVFACAFARTPGGLQRTETAPRAGETSRAFLRSSSATVGNNQNANTREARTRCHYATP